MTVADSGFLFSVFFFSFYYMEVLSRWSAKDNKVIKESDSEIENTLMKAGTADIRGQCSVCADVMEVRSC